MKRGLKVKIALMSGFSKGFVTRILSEKDKCKPSWDASKILAFVTQTNPVIWANKDVDAIHEALADIDPSELQKYNPQSMGAA